MKTPFIWVVGGVFYDLCKLAQYRQKQSGEGVPLMVSQLVSYGLSPYIFLPYGLSLINH